MTIAHFKIYCEIASSPHVLSRALKVSLIVGTLLNLINQGDLLLSLELEKLHLIKISLTYLVPFCVATYTATALNLDFKIGSKAVLKADLECKKCKYKIHIHKDALIPECPHCGIQTKWRLK